MAINTSSNKKIAGWMQPTTATVINAVYFFTAEPAGKAFSGVRAVDVLTGMTLHFTEFFRAPSTYCLAPWGQVRYLPTDDAALRFLEQIGGRL